ncbi:hypothetical protein MCEREM21A_02881 [Sphingomonadaceae bacterium]
MLEQEIGTKFIGYTGKKVCSKCKNSTPFVLRQQYVKQKIYFVIPVGTKHGTVKLICPICETEDTVTRASIFSSQQSYNNLESYLIEGKHYNKAWYEKQNEKNKKEFLKRLNSLKAYNMVKYLSDF